MKPIRPRARDYGDLGPGRPAKLGSKRGGLYPKLLQGVHRDQVTSAAKRAQTRDRTRCRLPGLVCWVDGDVCAHTVDREVVCVRALPIDAELAIIKGVD